MFYKELVTSAVAVCKQANLKARIPVEKARATAPTPTTLPSILYNAVST